MHNLPQDIQIAISILQKEGYTITPPAKPTGRMKVLPEDGTEYYYIKSIDYIVSVVEQKKFEYDCFDISQFILGNMFNDLNCAYQAKPEYLAWLNSEAKVLSRIAELNPEGWEPRFRLGDKNWYFLFDYNRMVVRPIYCSITKESSRQHYMATKEIAQQILAEMPEDVERMIRR